MGKTTPRNDSPEGLRGPQEDAPERHVLEDGGEVSLRLVEESDRQALVEGFEQLSRESKYFRFFTIRESLPEHLLDRLTNVDGDRHFALRVDLVPSGRPVAVGRYFRREDEPEVAELAITVADDQQGRGIGELLFRRLIAAALDRGIVAFECEVLAENRHVRRLIRKIDPNARSQSQRGFATYRIELSPSQTVMI